MLLSFKNTALRDLCSSDKLLQKRFGIDGMRKIRQLFDELDAAENLAVIGLLPGPRCEELKGRRAGQLSVRVHGGYRIIFSTAQDPAPTKPDGGLDWKAVTALHVLSIEDYHD